MKHFKNFFHSLSKGWHDLWKKKTQENSSMKFYFSESKISSFRFVLIMVISLLGLVIIDLLGYYIFNKRGGHNYIFTIPAIFPLLAIPSYFLAKLLAYHTHCFPKMNDRTLFAFITWFILTVLFMVLMIVFA